MTQEKDAQGVDLDIKDAMEGHERFRQQFDRDRAFYQGLATKKQKPRLLWIGCADSRVVPATITNADPGELFEIRNIANVVPPADAAEDTVGAAIEYGGWPTRHRRHHRVRAYGLRRHRRPARAGRDGLGSAPWPLDGVHQAGASAYRRGGGSGGGAADGDHQGARPVPARQPDDLPDRPRRGSRRPPQCARLVYDMHTGELTAYDPHAGGWRGLLE
ncbi:MAG: carbonic anhydrase [Hyphomicrobium sp.]